MKCSSLALAYSAKAPAHHPKTSSPERSAFTSGPTASTVPATSVPGTWLLGVRSPVAKRMTNGEPVMTIQSPTWTDAACTRTRTSSPAIVGLSISRVSRTSADPYRSCVIAFKIVLASSPPHWKRTMYATCVWRTLLRTTYTCQAPRLPVIPPIDYVVGSPAGSARARPIDVLAAAARSTRSLLTVASQRSAGSRRAIARSTSSASFSATSSGARASSSTATIVGVIARLTLARSDEIAACPAIVRGARSGARPLPSRQFPPVTCHPRSDDPSRDRPRRSDQPP